jgi:NADH dehydrogenase/NADH:ubiquinone oxidoreductase subunit G
VREHPDVVFEPGKCIHCGLCVRLCRQKGAALGLGFVGRGFASRVTSPFDEPLDRALADVTDVVDACPTGALSWKAESGV